MLRSFMNTTLNVEACLEERGICCGMPCIASVFVNDDESGLHQDFEKCDKTGRLPRPLINLRVGRSTGCLS